MMKTRRAAPLRAILLALALVGLSAPAALAHKVNIYAVAENGMITGEGYFTGGGKAMNCAVELRDASGALIGSGTSAADGSFSIPLPKGAKAPLRLVLKAGEGHQNDYTLTAQDLGQDTAAAAPGPAPASGSAPGSANAQGQGGASVSQSPSGQPGVAPGGQAADSEALASLVEAATAKAVEQKIAPLRLELAKMAELQDSGRVRDIVGGLGWIVGLMGIAAWFKRPKG